MNNKKVRYQKVVESEYDLDDFIIVSVFSSFLLFLLTHLASIGIIDNKYLAYDLVVCLIIGAVFGVISYYTQREVYWVEI